MDKRQSADLDRYITGNYGEDQFENKVERPLGTCERKPRPHRQNDLCIDWKSLAREPAPTAAPSPPCHICHSPNTVLVSDVICMRCGTRKGAEAAPVMFPVLSAEAIEAGARAIWGIYEISYDDLSDEIKRNYRQKAEAVYQAIMEAKP